MSFGFKHARAQYNYFPERTRAGGVGEVRSTDPKRPQVKESRPGNKPGSKRPYSAERPHR